MKLAKDNILRQFFIFIICLFFVSPTQAEVLTSGNVQITWKVVNRFRFFHDPAVFEEQERAWREYASRLAPRSGNADDTGNLLAITSVLGTEHVLNDRFIPFTDQLRRGFDWRGWAARATDKTCYDPKTHSHSACGGIDVYVVPRSHEIEISLHSIAQDVSLEGHTCHWHVGNDNEQVASCENPIRAQVPYPDGTTITVNADDERPISLDVAVRDLLIVGLGDSFASGEGNPDVPVKLDEQKRSQNIYPTRAKDGAQGSALWLDRLCHRSLYSYQLRAAMQVAIENPQLSVTFLGHACSGAAVDKGLIGPQSYVEFKSDDASTASPVVQAFTGSKDDGEFAWLLRELCVVAPVKDQGLWTCPDNKFRRSVDYVFLSVGGNDIGFSGLVSWTTLRQGALTKLASWAGVTVSPSQFQANIEKILPTAYEHLARQLEKAMPLPSGKLGYDPSHVILTAYPNILSDEKGETCQGIGSSGGTEDEFAANRSMDRYSNWLVVNQDKVEAAHSQLELLYKSMKSLAEANGWTFAGRAHTDKPFRGHGFCAKDPGREDDPAEVLMVPCWGKAQRLTQSCQPGILGQGTGWRPYNPATQDYPYALRQRWVRTINDAFMVINQKIVDRSGQIDEVSSVRDFTETTGAMHPNAEGNAALADAMLMDLRPAIAKLIDGQ